MFKKSVVLLVVMVMLVSFSAVVLAEDNEKLEGKAPKNEAGVEILAENEDGDQEIRFLDAVNENAKEDENDEDDKGNPDHPSNPIIVAGD